MNKGMYEKVLEDAVDFFTSGYEDGTEKPVEGAADAQGAPAQQPAASEVPRMKDV